jgi:ABC-2 type transport system ATP-binding protein
VSSPTTAAGVERDDAGMRRPTLDDVFLRLTGRGTDADEPAGDGASGADTDPAAGHRDAARATGTDAA